jgi:hypothetical protein
MTAAISVGAGLAIAAGAAAVGTVASGVMASNAAGKAARAQENAANTAANTQLTMYNQTRDDQAPWRAAGGTAVGQLSAGTAAGGEFNRNFTMADFNKDPGYQFRMDQGSQALQASAAARGGLMSGGTLKALDRYGQDYASNEYSNAYNRFNNDQTTRFNRLSSIAGLGQTATAQTGAAGMTAANQIGSAQMGYGNAQAAGYIGQSNAVNNGVSSLGNFYMQQQYMNRYAPSTTAPVGGAGFGTPGAFDGTSGTAGDAYASLYH